MWSRRGSLVAASFTAMLVMTVAGQSEATVIWQPDADGNWSEPSNWSSAPSLPGSTDDVIIDVGGEVVRLITLDTNSSIHSLTSQESLQFAGARTLTVTTGGLIGADAEFRMDTNARLNVNGGIFTVNGIANINGANVYATSALINLSTVTGYVTDTGTNNNRTLQASGTDSSINLAGLTSMQGGGFIRTLFVTTSGGASIDLSGLTDHSDGATRFTADGTNSRIDLSSLTSFHNSNSNGIGQLRVVNGGTISVDSLTSVSSSADDRMRIIIDGTSSSVDTSDITTFRNTLVQLLDGGQADLSSATDFGGSSLDVRAGVIAAIPDVVSYDPNTGGNSNRTWRARDSGSRIDAVNLATAQGGTFIRSWFIDAIDSGVVDLSALSSLTAGATRVSADGAGSLVDLSSLTSWLGAGSTLTATNGGEVRLTADPADAIDMQGVAVTVQPTGMLDLSRVRQFTSATLNSQGEAVITPFITDITDSSLAVRLGGSITLPGLTTTVYRHGGGNVQRSLIADGKDSSLDLSLLSGITIDAGISPSVRIDATNGGQIDLSGVTNIVAAPGIINGSRSIRFLADGDESLIDLSALQVFSDTASVTLGSITASNNAVVLLNDSGPTALTNLTVTVNSTGSIQGHTIELLGMFTNTSGQTAEDRIDDTRLRGDGLVTANVINTSGFISPGASVGRLTIDGDYVQAAAGVMVIELAGHDKPGTTYDQLVVQGDTFLGGTLNVRLIEGFELELDHRFDVLSVSGTLFGTFDDLLQGATVGTFNGVDLFIDYHSQTGVTLYTIPEPSSLMLLVIGGLAIIRRRGCRIH